MKFASVAVALASSVSTSAAGSTIGSDVAKKASFYFAMAPERDCAALQHNATACFEEKHQEEWERLKPCLDDADKTTDPCGGYRSCVGENLAQNHECLRYEEEILQCWGCGDECNEEEQAALKCMANSTDSHPWECSSGFDGPDVCSLFKECGYPKECADKVSEYKHCIKCPEPEQPTPMPEQPPVCEKEQEATDCIVWHAPGAMECLQGTAMGEEISLCDRINGCEKFGRCESKVKMAAKECWGCTDEGQTLPTQQFLKNVGRVLKKNIRG